MRRLLLLGGLLLGAVGGRTEDGLHSFSKTIRVVVSTAPASPTTLFATDEQVKHTELINNTTNYFLIGDADTTFSLSTSTGTARLPPNTSFTPDAPGSPYKGSMKAVYVGAGSDSLDVIRVK